jgi:drug/metabolite transporter (DMT)-like permease
MRTMRLGTGNLDAASRGAVLIMAGMVLLGLIDNFVRLIAADIGLWQFHFLRAALALPLLFVVGGGFGMRLRPRRWGRVAVRCVVQAGSMVIYFGALGFMPVPQVAAGLFTAPLFVLMFSAAAFGHRIGPRRLGAVALGFAGTLLMLRPDFRDLEPAVFLPIAAGALWGLANLLTREWCADEPVGALLAGFYLALGLAGGAATLVLSTLAEPGTDFLTRPWAAPSGPVWLWIGVQSVGSLVAVGLLTRGYQSGETSYLTVFEYFFLITASFWAWVIWGETIDAVGWLAIALIFASGLLIARSAAVPRAAQ